MATKHFCDGCDREIDQVKDIKRVRVTDLSLVGSETFQVNPRDFDLCGSCYQLFRSNYLPTSWARHMAEKAA